MSDILENTIDQISTGIRLEREARNWSLIELAGRSNVSKAMISKIERGESSPTTLVLGRLCGAFGITLSTFLVRTESKSGYLSRSADQPVWTDAETGCERILVSPSAGGQIEIVSVCLPGRAKVTFPASLYAVFHQTIWVLDGCLSVQEGELETSLQSGDCLELGSPSQVTFRNSTGSRCRYMVAATRRV